MSPVYNCLSENLRQHTVSRHVELLKPTTLFKNYINEACLDIQQIVTFLLNNTKSNEVLNYEISNLGFDINELLIFYSRVHHWNSPLESTWIEKVCQFIFDPITHQYICPIITVAIYISLENTIWTNAK